MGVDYLHLQLADGSDVYLTEFGQPFSRQLLPENHWLDKDWFARNNSILQGTSRVYRVMTKAVGGVAKDIVLKWNRMGQDIPGGTATADLAGAKFNSPFEEFSLVMELRNAAYESPGRIYTHRPLGIYVPRKFVEAERMGRKQYILDTVMCNHHEISLDANRNYAVIYEWIKGIDAAEAFQKGFVDKATMVELILRSNREMKHKGFTVRDSKPHHVIVRPTDDKSLAEDCHGQIAYAMIDFELLERTRERDEAMRAARRRTYLVKQAHRFEADAEFPPGLTPVNIMGVDYVYGKVASTGGRLWVVGRDPLLFEYFLPEKWRRTPRTRVSDPSHETYDTISKDSIHLVWRVSRVGRRPDVGPQAAAHGYNSPFEEIAFSMELSDNGIATTYPRAIYMTGHKPAIPVPEALVDESRYDSHAPHQTLDGHPILCSSHDHMVIWGYWNGPDELLAIRDEAVYTRIDALAARDEGHVSQEQYTHLMKTVRQRLADVGFEDLSLRGNHVLLSLEQSGRLATDDQGVPTMRLCNFELLKRIDPPTNADADSGGEGEASR